MARGPSSGDSLKAGLLCGPRASGPLLSAGCYRHNDGHYKPQEQLTGCLISRRN